MASSRHLAAGAHRSSEADDTSLYILEDLLECLVRVSADRIRHRPVQALSAPAQFLVRAIADGDNQVLGLDHVTHVGGATVIQRQAMTPRGADGPPVDAGTRMRAGGDGRHPAVSG